MIDLIGVGGWSIPPTTCVLGKKSGRAINQPTNQPSVPAIPTPPPTHTHNTKGYLERWAKAAGKFKEKQQAATTGTTTGGSSSGGGGQPSEEDRARAEELKGEGAWVRGCMGVCVDG